MKSTRNAQLHDHRATEYAKAQITKNEISNPSVGKEDYSTPVAKNEYIGLLKTQQERISDPHLQGVLQKEINHTKNHGINSGKQ